MIAANELRVNNWVFDGALGNNKVVQLDEDFLQVMFAARNYDDLQPIPLTPEILIACGLKLHTSVFPTYDIGKISIHLPSNDYKNGRTYFNQWCIIEGVPEYLHQLQNFHFALTGKELTYNPIIK